MLADAETFAVGGRLVAERLAPAFAIHMVRRYSSLQPHKPTTPRTVQNGRLRHVLDHMKANLADLLALTHIAAVVGTSLSQFALAFREATGEPPDCYLIRLRIGQARNLLENTTLTVIEVGLSCASSGLAILQRNSGS